MMKILEFSKVDDCLEGKNVYDLTCDELITEVFAFYIGKLGKMTYNTSFDRPFFRIIIKGKYTIKGSVGYDLIRVLLPDDENDEIIKSLIKYLHDFKIINKKTC